MTLVSGTKLGPYEIIAPLGAGGMGEVYKAKDTRLDRMVAIKVLPEDLAKNPDSLARFEREAKAVAALNHPNITGIFDIGHVDDIAYAVMELLEGESLRTRLLQGALTPRVAIELAVQMAHGLAAAHDKGVIHRDLKPDNLWITTEGRLKILDFGLAKQVAPAGRGSQSFLATEAVSPGHVLHTEEGMILGTMGYMSPEQVRGETVDARSDIFSFGVVLFEMLTGQKAFARDTASETMAAILRDDPPESETTGKPIPMGLRRILDHCLEKVSTQRFHDAHDLAFALESLSLASSGSGAMPGLPSATPGKVLPWRAIAVTALLSACGMGAIAWVVVGRGLQGGNGLAIEPELTRITSDAGLTMEPAVSPNGSLLAYASDRGGASLNIWVQPLPSGQPVQVTQDLTNAHQPSFSPDGSRIAFRSEREGGGIYVVPALGGTARFVAPKGQSPRFSPDGKRIAYDTGGRGSPSETWIIEEAGGQPSRLARDLENALRPVWSPDGTAIAVMGGRKVPDSKNTWYRIDLASGSVAPLQEEAILKEAGITNPLISEWLPGKIIFFAESGDSKSLWSVGISSDGRRVMGPLQRLTAGTGNDESPTVASGPFGLHLYFASLDVRANLYRLPILANEGRATGEPQPLTDTAAWEDWPSLSVDGRSLVFISNRQSFQGAWLKNLDTQKESPIGAVAGRVVISPDGQRVAYRTKVGDEFRLAVQAIGGGVVQSIPKDPRWLWDWPTPDRLVTSGLGDERAKLHALDLATGTLRPLMTGTTGQFYGMGRLSPDGHWMSAMEWTTTGRSRVIVFPFRETPVTPAEFVVISEEDSVAQESAWSPDGQLLYFVSERDGNRCVWVRQLDPRTKHPIGPLSAVLHLHGARRSMISTTNSPARIEVGQNELVFSMQLQRGNIWKIALRNPK